MTETLNPVGITEDLPGSNGGFCMAVFESAKVPVGTPLFTRPTPDAAMRKALETARDYVSDAARGFLTYEASGEGFMAMATEDLACIDAALAEAPAVGGV